MPIYQYQCEFGHFFEEHQSIKEYKCGQTRNCPNCGNVMERIIGEPILVSVDNVTTVGQLGERNFKALGKYKGEEFLAKEKEKKKKAEKAFLEEAGSTAESLPEYRHQRRLANLTKKQQERYIQTGKLPPEKRRTK